MKKTKENIEEMKRESLAAVHTQKKVFLKNK